MAGLDPAIPLGKALRPDRDHRIKPGDDTESAEEFYLIVTLL
jgi:hypothetical protein